MRAAILADKAGPATLHVNYCPCTSSLRQTGTFAATAYKHSELLGDYLFSQAFRTVRQLKGNASTLDKLSSEHADGIDCLSVDTQGTEDQVLEGAREQLQRNTLAVVCEVGFREFYAGQPLLGDITRQMSSRGFEFVRLLRTNNGEFSDYRKPMGWRARGMMDFDDALFFKRIIDIRRTHQHPGRSLFKAAFLALSYGHLEWALEAVEQAMNEDSALVLREGQNCKYLPFLARLHDLYQRTPQLFPPTLEELYSLEESAARFAEHIPHHWDIYDVSNARARYFAHADRAVFDREIIRLLAPEPTPVERLLQENGFTEAARFCATKRQHQARATVGALHLAK